MNGNLLYLVARHNVERIHGDRRFNWIDNSWINAVVTEGARLPNRAPDHDHHDPAVQHDDHAEGATAPAKRKRSRSGSKTKMVAMAARTRGRRTK